MDSHKTFTQTCSPCLLLWRPEVFKGVTQFYGLKTDQIQLYMLTDRFVSYTCSAAEMQIECRCGCWYQKDSCDYLRDCWLLYSLHRVWNRSSRCRRASVNMSANRKHTDHQNWRFETRLMLLDFSVRVWHKHENMAACVSGSDWLWCNSGALGIKMSII